MTARGRSRDSGGRGHAGGGGSSTGSGQMTRLQDSEHSCTAGSSRREHWPRPPCHRRTGHRRSPLPGLRQRRIRRLPRDPRPRYRPATDLPEGAAAVPAEAAEDLPRFDPPFLLDVSEGRVDGTGASFAPADEHELAIPRRARCARARPSPRRCAAAAFRRRSGPLASPAGAAPRAVPAGDVGEDRLDGRCARARAGARAPSGWSGEARAARRSRPPGPGDRFRSAVPPAATSSARRVPRRRSGRRGGGLRTSRRSA